MFYRLLFLPLLLNLSFLYGQNPEMIEFQVEEDFKSPHNTQKSEEIYKTNKIPEKKKENIQVVEVNKIEEVEPIIPEIEPIIPEIELKETEITAQIKGPKKIPPIDGIIVIDTSLSMYVITENVKKKWTGFLSPLMSADFRFAIIDSNVSADGERKNLLPLEYGSQEPDGKMYIHKGLEDPNMVLVNSLNTLVCKNFPFCGSGYERPLGSLEQYFQSYQDEFIREDIDKLFVIILTDNNEYNKKGQNAPTTSQEVMDSFENTFPDKELVVLSLTVTDGLCKKQFRTGLLLSIFGEANTSKNSTQLAQRTNGEVFSLCLDSYEAVAQHIIQSLETNVD